MPYFTNFPKVLLPSFSDNRSSSFDYVETTNIFKRGKIRDDIYGSLTSFRKFVVAGDDRPDNVANTLYGDPTLDWIVLLSNNIVNVRDEWPMNGDDFKRYLDNKYGGPENLNNIHHYETIERRNSQNIIIQTAGISCDANHTFIYSENGLNYTETGCLSVSNLEYEEKKNDKKREIFALLPQYIGLIKEDMRAILTYTDSSQFVNRKLKKGDNLRIASPR